MNLFKVQCPTLAEKYFPVVPKGYEGLAVGGWEE